MSNPKITVKFTLPGHRIDECMRGVLLDVFGIEIKYGCCNDITITCRPSQWGIFIICRSGRGLKNWIYELNAELFSNGKPIDPNTFDVSEDETNFSTID